MSLIPQYIADCEKLIISFLNDYDKYMLYNMNSYYFKYFIKNPTKLNQFINDNILLNCDFTTFMYDAFKYHNLGAIEFLSKKIKDISLFKYIGLYNASIQLYQYNYDYNFEINIFTQNINKSTLDHLIQIAYNRNHSKVICKIVSNYNENDITTAIVNMLNNYNYETPKYLLNFISSKKNKSKIKECISNQLFDINAINEECQVLLDLKKSIV